MRSLGFGARAALTAAAAPILLPTSLAGQEMPEPACIAQISPAAVQAGANAVRVMASLSQDVGMVTGVEPSEESRIAMASPEDLPRTQMVAGGEPPRPIQMGAGENTWTLFLNTADAKPGDHTIRIIADGGVCGGSLSVTPGSE